MESVLSILALTCQRHSDTYVVNEQDFVVADIVVLAVSGDNELVSSRYFKLSACSDLVRALSRET